MCDSSEVEPERKIYIQRQQLREGFCAKCKASVPNAAIRNAFYCFACLSNNIIHKFRQNIFKAGIEKGTKAMVAFSGGHSARCLLDLMQHFHCEENRSNHFSSYIVCNVQEYPLESEGIINGLVICPFKSDPNDSQDIKSFKILHILLEQAKIHECSCILFGDNQTRVAIKSITHTAKGRGLSLVDDISLCQEINGIKLIRPLRDTVAKEIGFYNYYNKVPSFGYPPLEKQKPSIDSITASI